MKNTKKIIISVLIVLFLAIFVFSAYKIISHVAEENRQEEAFDRLTSMVRRAESLGEVSSVSNADDPSAAEASGSGGGEDSSTAAEKPEMLAKYVPIYDLNHDVFGWITIEGTVVDYPVMFTPHDDQYYINRDFEGNYSAYGVPFIDGACPPDGNFYLIYGHHMKNKSMFGVLPNYADKSFAESHSLIQFDTLYEKRTYKVMAAFESQIFDSSAPEGTFKYSEYRDLSDESRFNEYVSGVTSLSMIDTGVSAQFGDELITLSTCNYHTENGRFVVVAKRIK